MDVNFDGGGSSLADISDDESLKSPSFENLLSSAQMDTSDDDTSIRKRSTGANPKVKHTPQPPCPSTHRCSPSALSPPPPPSLGSQLLPSPPPPPTPPVPPKISATPRHKAYPDESKGPWVVFFRTKQKPLNVARISNDLAKRFSAVTDIEKVTPNKLRVTVGSRKQANDIVACELFSIEYRVYIPSRDVEVEGVVTEASMTCDDFLKDGVGVFKNRVFPKVKILDCIQLQSVSLVGTKKVYSLSDSFRVTFSGSALPNYVAIGKVRLPVRLFVPRVMNCLKCKQLGHTADFCCNKPRCDICGERHVEGPCSNPPKCGYCMEAPHALSDCPKYKQRGEQLKRSLKARSKRSFAEILKATASSSQNTPKSNNRFTVLPDDDQGSDSEVGEENPFVFKGNTRKRARKNVAQKPRKTTRTDSQATLIKSTSSGKKPKTTPPGFKPFNFEKDFPQLPGTSKTPDTRVLQPREQLNNQPEHAPMFTFSGIVDSIFTVFNVSDSTRNIINLVLPIVKTLLKQLASKWSFLASIISFDG